MKKIIINLGRVGVYEYTEEDFIKGIFSVKEERLDRFEIRVFNGFSLREKFFFRENKEENQEAFFDIVNKYFSSLILLHEKIVKDDVLFSSGADVYEILFQYEQMLRREIEKNKIIGSILGFN